MPEAVTDRLMSIYDRLLSHFGPRGWWPGDTAFEVMVGAVLTQNTAWTNVAKAIARLKSAGVLSPDGLARISRAELAALIRPAGYYNLKTDRLKSLVDLVMEDGDDDPPRLLRRPLPKLRANLLAVKGIGPETADSILLYAAGYPVFVVDAYTRRILSRHGLIPVEASYDQLQQLFMDHLSPNVSLFNEFHALIVALGHRYCKTKPRCQDCPLKNPV